MRNILSIFISVLFFYVTAQQPIEVKIEQRPSSAGVHPAFEMAIPQATEKDAIELWENTIIDKKFLKKSEKLEKIKDEWLVNDIVIGEISPLPLNVITQVSSFTGQIYVRIFLQNQDEFIGSDPENNTTTAAVRYIRNYGVELYREAVAKELKAEEKTLEALEKDLEQLIKKNSSYDGKIEDAQKDQRSLAAEADYNQRLLNNTESEDVEDILKTAEKDLKKAEKTEKKFIKKVGKNEEEQMDKLNEIERQKEIVLLVKTKLENIR